MAEATKPYRVKHTVLRLFDRDNPDSITTYNEGDKVELTEAEVKRLCPDYADDDLLGDRRHAVEPWSDEPQEPHLVDVGAGTFSDPSLPNANSAPMRDADNELQETAGSTANREPVQDPEGKTGDPNKGKAGSSTPSGRRVEAVDNPDDNK